MCPGAGLVTELCTRGPEDITSLLLRILLAQRRNNADPPHNFSLPLPIHLSVILICLCCLSEGHQFHEAFLEFQSCFYMFKDIFKKKAKKFNCMCAENNMAKQNKMKCDK